MGRRLTGGLEGIPAKVVAEVLGHSSTQITLDVYSHVTPGMQADATTRVARLFGAPRRRALNAAVDSSRIPRPS